MPPENTSTDSALAGTLRDPDWRAVITWNYHLPAEVLAELARDPDGTVRAAAERRIDAQDSRQGRDDPGAVDAPTLRSLIAGGYSRRLEAIGRTSECAATLTEAAGCDHGSVRFAVAKNTSTPPDVLRRLVDDKSKDVRYVAARNPAIPAETLATLATSNDEERRRAAASNHAAGESMLSTLAGDAAENVRLGVAQNATVTASVLRRLFEDPSELVRFEAACHATAAGMLEDLLAAGRLDFDSALAVGAASNRACPTLVLGALAEIDDNLVADAVLRNPASSRSHRDELLRRLPSDVFLNRMFVGPGLAKGSELPDLSEQTLRFLAADSDDTGRRIIAAAHPDTPAPVLADLAGDAEEEVRRAVAQNPRCPADVLSTFAGAESMRIRCAVAAHADCPPRPMAVLAHDSEEEVRIELAQNPSTTVDVIAVLLADTDEVCSHALQNTPHAARLTAEMLRHATSAPAGPTL